MNAKGDTYLLITLLLLVSQHEPDIILALKLF